MGRNLSVQQLARSGAAEWEVARSHRAALLASARSLVRSANHRPGVAGCEAAGCALADTGNADLCSVAHRLARISDRDAEGLEVAQSAVAQAAAAFRHHLTGALDAVRACRQTAHPSGECWFSAEPGEDGCAPLLRLAHDSSG
jgi:hypothetical protein